MFVFLFLFNKKFGKQTCTPKNTIQLWDCRKSLFQPNLQGRLQMLFHLYIIILSMWRTKSWPKSYRNLKWLTSRTVRNYRDHYFGGFLNILNQIHPLKSRLPFLLLQFKTSFSCNKLITNQFGKIKNKGFNICPLNDVIWNADSFRKDLKVKDLVARSHSLLVFLHYIHSYT
jgi:hypothetical protein